MTIVYLGVALAALWFVSSKLEVSPLHVAKVIFAEFETLLRGEKNRGSINAFLLCSLSFIAVLYLFVNPIKDMLEIILNLSHSHGGSAYEFIAVFFTIAVTGILCVRSV